MCFKETTSLALTPTPSGLASTGQETAYSPKREGQWLPKSGLPAAISLLARGQLHGVAQDCLLTLRFQGRSYLLLLPGSECTIIQQTWILQESRRGLMCSPGQGEVLEQHPEDLACFCMAFHSVGTPLPAGSMSQASTTPSESWSSPPVNKTWHHSGQKGVPAIKRLASSQEQTRALLNPLWGKRPREIPLSRAQG